MRLFPGPTRPQQAAGMRIRPPPSEPWAIRTIPAATAAAAPPEDPPGVRPVSQGLRVGPCRRGSVTGRIPNSGRFVLPTTTNPASRMRRTTKASCCGTKSPNSSEPAVMGSPLTGAPSLIAIGTPANGRSSPGDRLRRGQGVVGVHVDERVDLSIQRPDGVERRPHKLARADLAGADHGGELRRRLEHGLPHAGTSSLRSTCVRSRSARAPAVQQLLGERQVVGSQVRRVVEDRHAALRGLGVADRAPDDAVQELVAEAVLELLERLARGRAACPRC